MTEAKTDSLAKILSLLLRHMTDEQIQQVKEEIKSNPDFEYMAKYLI